MKLVEENGVVRSLLTDVHIPRMVKVRQNFSDASIEDVPARVRELISDDKFASLIKPGMRIAVTCGSRGINHIKEIIREVCRFVRERGGVPFIIPSMGSHGGATAEGQRQIIESYGVTEEYCGASIRSDMTTIKIGETADGRDVFIDKNAATADGIIVVGRIKHFTEMDLSIWLETFPFLVRQFWQMHLSFLDSVLLKTLMTKLHIWKPCWQMK